MRFDAQLLSAGGGDTPPFIVLQTESKRYLFNCGEGLQRAAGEHKVRLSRCESVFLTSLSTTTVGGLPGLLLSLADNYRKTTVSLVGPQGLQQYLRALRFFYRRPDLHLSVTELSESSETREIDFGESELIVEPIVTPSSARADKDDVSSPPASERGCGGGKNGCKDERVCCDAEEQPEQGRKQYLSRQCKRRKMSDAQGPATISYFCRTHSVRGSFKPQEALRRGVPRGPLFARLHRGEDVTLDDGTVVRSADCVSAPDPAPVIGIIACPSISSVDSLCENSSFAKYFSERSHSDDLSHHGDQVAPKRDPIELTLLYHLGPLEVLCSEKYSNWVENFGAAAKHVLVNRQLSPPRSVFVRSTELQLRLHHLQCSLFPQPREVLAPSLAAEPDKQDAATECPDLANKRRTLCKLWDQTAFCLGRDLLTFKTLPRKKRGFDKAIALPSIDVEKIQQEMDHFIDNNADARRTKEELKRVQADDDVCKEDAGGQILFLGTGSCMPSKYRNVSSVYLATERGGVLLDAGEGTLGQLWRSFGAKLRNILAALRLVIISHMHADHHLGLPSILAARRKQSAPVLVVGPYPLGIWLKEYAAVDSSIVDAYIFVDCRHYRSHVTFQSKHAMPEAASGGEQAIGEVETDSTITAQPTARYGVVSGRREHTDAQDTYRGKESVVDYESNTPVTSTRSLQEGQRGYAAPALRPLSPTTSVATNHCLEAVGIASVEMVPVLHCYEAYAAVLHTTDGWSVAYSGDCRPSEEFATAAKGVTIMIHEATFENGMAEEAIDRRHCTIEEALTVSSKAQAERVLLTHFSQRYPKTPVLPENLADKVLVASDLMLVRLARMDWGPSLLPALSAIFASEEDDEEDEKLQGNPISAE